MHTCTCTHTHAYTSDTSLCSDAFPDFSCTHVHVPTGVYMYIPDVDASVGLADWAEEEESQDLFWVELVEETAQLCHAHVICLYKNKVHCNMMYGAYTHVHNVNIVVTAMHDGRNYFAVQVHYNL